MTALLLGAFAVISLLAVDPTWVDVFAAATIIFLGYGAVNYKPGGDDE